MGDQRTRRHGRRFSAFIKRKGINAYVDVPPPVSSFFGLRGNVLVKATLGGRAFPATLVPVGTGRHILYINMEMRKAADADVGDRLRVFVCRDTRSRMPAMLDALAVALRKHPRARKAWEALPNSRRKEILLYLHAMKKPESVARNVKKALAKLEGRNVPLPTGM